MGRLLPGRVAAGARRLDCVRTAFPRAGARMTMLKSLALAFSCFSSIPVPQVEWNSDNMRYLMACFPLVGVVIGFVLLAWWWLCDFAALGMTARAVGIVLVPLVVSGGIHLDGFADVVDAQSSNAEPERKHAILKDPHVGAFAVIGIVSYLLAYVGLASELATSWAAAAVLACVPVLVRCESGLAAVLLSGAGQGMLASFRSSARTNASVAAICAEFAVAAAIAVVNAPLPGCAVLMAGVVCLGLLRPFARRNFGGMTGDVAGFFLCVCELAMVAALVVAAKAVGL